MDTSKNDRVSGKMQLQSAKVGANGAKVRRIRSIYLSPLATTKHGNTIKSISSDGHVTVIRPETTQVKPLCKRNRLQKDSFKDSLSKYLHIAELSAKIGAKVTTTKPKKPQTTKVDMAGFKAWQQTQNSFRALK